MDEKTLEAEKEKLVFSNSRIFLVFLLFFWLGIFSRLAFLDNFFWNFFSEKWFWGVGFFLFLFYFYQKRKWLVVFFFLLGLFLGIWKTEKALEPIFWRPEVTLKAKVLVWDEPEKSGQGMKMEIKLLDETKEKILFLSRESLIFKVGDVVEVNCQTKNPEKIEGWNYPFYLASKHIYQLCEKGTAKKVGDFKQIKDDLSKIDFWRITFLKKSYAGRKFLEEKIYQRLTFPESGFLAGLLLGGDGRLDKQTQENFRRAGVTHLVAVSGYNITLLGTFLMWLAFSLGFWRQQAFWLAVAGIVFFVFSIGTPISALRAAIMGILVLLAVKGGRLANSLRILILTGALMLWFSPLILFYDSGFQLSFLATFSLITLYSSWSKKFKIEKDFLELKSILLTTISAQLGVLGILIFSFKKVSLISLLANFLILPLIPWLTLGGFFLILLELVVPYFAEIFASFLFLGLHLEIFIVKILASFSWSEIAIEGLGVGFLTVYYLFFGLLIYQAKRKCNT